MWTRVIYTTITLMAVLIIYDGWEQLRSWNVVTVIVGPLLAIFPRARAAVTFMVVQRTGCTGRRGSDAL